MTPDTTTILEQGVRLFKVRVDWLCWKAYGDKVVVELHVMDEEPKVLRSFPGPPQAGAVEWARKWIEDRGFDFWCNIDLHQRENHTHITLHPKPKKNHEAKS
jgi:hypothetical protein